MVLVGKKAQATTFLHCQCQIPMRCLPRVDWKATGLKTQFWVGAGGEIQSMLGFHHVLSQPMTTRPGKATEKLQNMSAALLDNDTIKRGRLVCWRECWNLWPLATDEECISSWASLTSRTADSAQMSFSKTHEYARIKTVQCKYWLQSEWQSGFEVKSVWKLLKP